MIIQDDDWRTVLERISYLKREMASLEEMITGWPRKEIMSTGTKCQKCLKSRKTHVKQLVFDLGESSEIVIRYPGRKELHPDNAAGRKPQS